MLNIVQEYQMPSPVNGQQFQLTTISGSVVGQRVQGQNVFMSVLAQGTSIATTVTRTYQWQSVGSSWEDDQQTQLLTYFTTLAFPNTSWVLLEVQLK
jgi:hypothetical protein